MKQVVKCTSFAAFFTKMTIGLKLSFPFHHARRHAHADQQHLMALRLSGFSIDAALLGITIWHNGWAMLGILTNIYV